MLLRYLNLESILGRKSLFLFGPRQTGKTTYLKKRFPKAIYIDLLDLENLRNFTNHPRQLQNYIKEAAPNFIIIDEIQKMPELLNEVHRLIEQNKKVRFILTGSSARRLKKVGVNLLGGRASEIHFHPLTLNELRNESWSLQDAMKWGMLPSVITSEDPKSELKDYVQVYLQREIKEEALVKKFLNFSRFLDFAALTNTEQLNFTSLGSDAQLSPRTVQDYYSILEDTLIGSQLLPYQKTTRKAVSTSKFYFFDVGVVNFMNRTFEAGKGSQPFAKAFEQLIFCELNAFKSYLLKMDIRLSYWRTHTQVEVDFILEIENEIYAIEVKSSSKPRKSEYSGLLAFKEEYPQSHLIVVCMTPQSYEDQKIKVLTVKDFVNLLWSNSK